MTDMQSLAKEMVEQDNLSTQYPFWFVRVREQIWVNYMADYDGKVRVEDTDTDNLCEQCRDLIDDDKELPENCDMCDYEAFNYYRLDWTFDLMSGGYFTQKACQEHIDENKHHYNEPHTYAYSAWRNPDLIMVMQTIITGAGLELPSHYR